MKRYFILAMAALFLAAACQKVETPQLQPGKIQVEPIITKAATEGSPPSDMPL